MKMKVLPYTNLKMSTLVKGWSWSHLKSTFNDILLTFIIKFKFAVDSAEIQILNPWVKIPDDWNSGSYSDESSTSSESSYSMSSAQAQYYSSSYGGSNTGTEPFFDHAMMTNLSEYLGNHAFLRCRVKKLGEGIVSSLLFLLYRFPLYYLELF